MKQYKSSGSIAACLFEILVGILLLIKPIGFTTSIIILAGVLLAGSGIGNIVKYFRTDAKEAVLGQHLMKGLVALLGGLFCVFNSGWFLATFPILTMIYGLAMLVGGLGKVQVTVDMIRLKRKKWFLAAIGAVVSIICAVVILGSPFASTAALWMFTGITLIVEAVIDAITIIMSGRDTAKE